MKIIGDYLLQKILSRGHCGDVWRALDQRRGQLVVVRFLPEAFRVNAEAMNRFHRRFSAAQAFQHPHAIAPARFVDDSEDGPFWVARFVDGPLLEEYASQWAQAEGRFPVHLIFDVLQPIASALDEARHCDLTHRQLSSSSVVVSPIEGVQVFDFELIGIVRESLHPPGEAQQLRFLAPEQINGQDVTFSTDQYSLGAIAYELFGGRFPGANVALLPLLDQPEDVNKVLRRAMHHDPALRFPTCQEFLNALSKAVTLQSESVPAPSALPEPLLLPATIPSFTTIASVAAAAQATSVTKRIHQERRFQQLFHLWNFALLVTVLVVAVCFREKLFTLWNQRITNPPPDVESSLDLSQQPSDGVVDTPAVSPPRPSSTRTPRTPSVPKEIEFNGPEESPFKVQGIIVPDTPDEVRFAGTSGTGKRVVFVVDASAVMGGGRQTPLSHARKELAFSFQDLNATQRFQVVYFNETTNTLPTEETDLLISVSPSNLKRSHAFLETVKGTGRGDPKVALLKAIALKPDLIFFLSDENAVQLTTDQIESVKREADAIPIHGVEIGNGMEPDQPTAIKTLAAVCRGQFQWVNASLHGLARLK